MIIGHSKIESPLPNIQATAHSHIGHLIRGDVLCGDLLSMMGSLPNQKGRTLYLIVILYVRMYGARISK